MRSQIGPGYEVGFARRLWQSKGQSSPGATAEPELTPGALRYPDGSLSRMAPVRERSILVLTRHDCGSADYHRAQHRRWSALGALDREQPADMKSGNVATPRITVARMGSSPDRVGLAVSLPGVRGVGQLGL